MINYIMSHLVSTGIALGVFTIYTIVAYATWASARKGGYWHTSSDGDEFVDAFPFLTFVFVHLWYAMRISFQLTIKIMELVDIANEEKQTIKDLIRKAKNKDANL